MANVKLDLAHLDQSVELGFDGRESGSNSNWVMEDCILSIHAVCFLQGFGIRS